MSASPGGDLPRWEPGQAGQVPDVPILFSHEPTAALQGITATVQFCTGEQSGSSARDLLRELVALRDVAAPGSPMEELIERAALLLDRAPRTPETL